MGARMTRIVVGVGSGARPRGRRVHGECPGQGHADHCAGHPRRPGHGPHRRYAGSARPLPRADLGLARRVRSREGRHRSRRRGALDARRRRQELDVLSPQGPQVPQRRSRHRPRREVQPRADHDARVDLIGRGRAPPRRGQDRRAGRLHRARHHQGRHPALRRQPLPRRLHGRQRDAEEVHRDGGDEGLSREADRQRPVEVRPQRPRRPHRVRSGDHARTGAAPRSSRR